MTWRRLALPALGAALVALLPGPGARAAGPTVGPDYVASDNVRFIENIRLPGQAAGAKVIGHYLYVTSSKDIEIYDITTPSAPALVSQLSDVEIGWENEQVPTNGRILGFSQQGTGYAFVSAGGCATVNQSTTNCLVIWDVTDKANPKIITTISGAGDHTSTCVFDCRYMIGSSGSVSDLTHVMDAGHPATKISTGSGWQTGLPGKSCHNQTEVSPGLVLAACAPFELVSFRAQDGATMLKPRLLATGTAPDGRFIHGVDWPQQGTDRFVVEGGETNVTPNCDLQNSAAFSTWDATQARTTGKFRLITDYKLHNGDYIDGSPPANISGCSTHWFESHPTFHNGGLIALANYEHGDRFLQITPTGGIVEVGLFEGLGGAASAMHWAPNSNVVYSIDYQRGIDVLEWTGPLYVPQSASDGASAAGTGVAAAGAAGGLANTAGAAAGAAGAGAAALALAVATLGGLRCRRRGAAAIAGRRRGSAPP